MEDACSVVELLQSMYYGEDEFRFRTDGDQALFEQLQAGTPSANPASIVFEIRLPLAGNEADRLTLVCSVAAHNDNYELSVASGANATWLSREAHEQLTASLADHAVDPDMDRASQLTEKIQHVLEQAELVYQERQLQVAQQAEAAAAAKEPVRFMREWIWFPMIYTREKVHTRLSKRERSYRADKVLTSSEDISLIGRPSTVSLAFSVQGNQDACVSKGLRR